MKPSNSRGKAILERIDGLVRLIEASRDGFLDGKPYILTYSDIINELNELAAALAAEGQGDAPQLDNWIAEFSLTDESDVLDEFTLDEQAKIWGLMRIAWNTAAERTAAPSLHKEEHDSIPSAEWRRGFEVGKAGAAEAAAASAALHKEGAGGEPILKRVKLYLDSWAEHPAKELGEQATAYVHDLLRELYEASSPAGQRMAGAEVKLNGQAIWFHGTNYRTALKIEKEGFRSGTWFARHMEDAVEFGGVCVFWVKVRFYKTPLKWQVCCTNKLPASAIIKRMDIVRSLPPQ